MIYLVFEVEKSFTYRYVLSFTFHLFFQVPHAKGKISQLYHLHVLVPSAYILGSDEYHVGVGSTINLVCIIENVSQLYDTFNYILSRPQKIFARSSF